MAKEICVYSQHPEIDKAQILKALHKTPNPEDIIYSGRNLLYKAELGGRQWAVKKFAKGIWHAIAYSFHSSKAKRSMLHAESLLSIGIDTPEPLAYAERRGPGNLLLESWYISAYREDKSLKDGIAEGIPGLMEAFASLAAKMHEFGVLHRDMNNTNVRIKKTKESMELSLIDLNRMRIPKEIEASRGSLANGNPNRRKCANLSVKTNLSVKECARDLCRWSEFDKNFETFVDYYVAERGWGEREKTIIFKEKRHHDQRIARKRARRAKRHGLVEE